MSKDTLAVMIGGEAGQGLATVGQVLAKALVRGGWQIVMTQSYHSRIRGGHNTMTVRASRHDIQAGREGVDLVVALNQETIDLHGVELNPGGLVVGDAGLDFGGLNSLAVPFDELAPGRVDNVFALGVAARLMGVGQDTVLDAMQGFLGHLDQDAAKANAKALEDGFAWAAERTGEFEPLTPADSPPRPRLMLQSNQAIAYGAISAGVKACFFYPMTPATSIALAMISEAQRMGLVVEQAEDEIAAINMGIGASFAGAPALVPTSGGGFALMGEGLSLAGMTETPLVLALIMRPGPATGLPTRTEQGDLELALFSGHGEFPRAVFAPSDPVEAFHLTRKAVETAERFQTPVIILGDQYLADSFRAVDPKDLETDDDFTAPWLAEFEGDDYQRYVITPDGVSPRLVPGAGKVLVVADSDEHDEQGHITEDLAIRKRMVHKRLAKLESMKKQALPPKFSGPENPETMLICWGSSFGPLSEAADELNQAGGSVGVCHFSQLWPLNPETFADRLRAAGRLVCVEGNATGQFAHLLRREAVISPEDSILRYDGLPITPELILSELNHMREAR